MSIYKISQWILIFFIYCFIGWIWESSFKSIQQKKWINRGFLNGPWLPIYGFGALIILFVTLPFKNHHFFIFLFGMIAASIFEFFVGFAMEKIFHARYWNYSNIPFNIKGYIALPVSILWGFFSLILVDVINVPIHNFISNIPIEWTYLFDAVFICLFILDTVLSTIQALNLKHILNLHTRLHDFKNSTHIEFNISSKVLKKAEKVFNRNPSLLSNRHKLNKNDIHHLLINLKNNLKND